MSERREMCPRERVVVHESAEWFVAGFRELGDEWRKATEVGVVQRRENFDDENRSISVGSQTVRK